LDFTWLALQKMMEKPMRSFTNQPVGYGNHQNKGRFMRFLFIIFMGILLSALVATAVGSLSGELIHRLFLTVNETLIQ